VKYRRDHEGRGYQGRRLTIRNWLIQHGMPAEHADAWLDAWEETPRAASIHPEDPEYWYRAAAWIVQQRNARKSPS
jgi:hypothetical protein